VPKATKPRNSASESDKRGNITDEATTARARPNESRVRLKATARFKRSVASATCNKQGSKLLPHVQIFPHLLMSDNAAAVAVNAALVVSLVNTNY
jgi:hypothetical protein